MIINYIFLGLFGLMVGSFLGMLSYRLPRGITIGGRSFCDNCDKKISWYNNIPIISFLLLGGKCKNCKASIPFSYLLIEIFTGLMFVASGYYSLSLKFHGLFLSNFTHTLGIFCLPLLLAIVSVFISLIFIDYHTQLLPDVLVYFLGLLTIIYLFALPSPGLVTHLYWGFLAFLTFLIIYLITQGRGMGFGDVKLAFVVGMLLGYPQTIVWFLLSFLLGAVVGIILLITRVAKIGQPIPFGPFLIISAFIAALWGDWIFVWYLTRLAS